MKTIIFDTGPVISLTMNNLLWLLPELKKQFKGKFLIPRAVKRELIDKPLRTKRFEFEALQVMQHIKSNDLTLVEQVEIKKRAEQILALANTCFKARGRYIQIVHFAEAETVAAYLTFNSDALCLDERTTTLLIENPERIAKILEKKLHTKIHIEMHNLEQIKKQLKHIKIIRSAELVTIAYEMGLLDKYIKDTDISKTTLLDSVLWGVKLDGCAISAKEIAQIIRLER